MTHSHFALVTAILLLAACTAPISSDRRAESGYIRELPEGVLAIAAPYQNLSAVRVLPEDGCYWYLHNGPVESTWLPLRTNEGRPICTQAATKS